MEKNIGVRRQNAKARRRSVLGWILTRLAILALVAACLISLISTQATIMQKRAEQAELEAAIARAQEEQRELEKFSDSNDLEGYMERAAIEDLNYAYPNERRFYDTSRN